MAQKTFNIGENCLGDKVTVETGIGTVKFTNPVEGKKEFNLFERNAYLNMAFWLEDLTTHFYTEKVMEWVTVKTGLKKQLFFE